MPTRLDPAAVRLLVAAGLRPGGAAIVLGCSAQGARDAFLREGYVARPRRPWTAAELAEVRRLATSGLGAWPIAAALGRSKASASGLLRRMRAGRA